MFNMFRALCTLDEIIQEQDEQIKFLEKKRSAVWCALYKLQLENAELQRICDMRKNDLSIVSSYSTGAGSK